MIIGAAEEGSKTTTHARSIIVVMRSQDELGRVEGPPSYTYGQLSLLAMLPSLPSTSNDMSSPSLPLLRSPHSHSHSQPPVQQQQQFYPHPVLRVTTIPYDSHSSHSHGRSSLPAFSARPTYHTITRFFTSFIVALGILFLWLLLVQSIRTVVVGHDGFRWGPPPHYGGTSRHAEEHWRATPVGTLALTQ